MIAVAALIIAGIALGHSVRVHRRLEHVIHESAHLFYALTRGRR